ncbi:hypothetical protein [Thioclava sp.]|uniref:hypothetical protein n=1 Tax=Thioclava sp. TaxID=1933450 RepID=UPI00324220F2
MTNDFTKEAKAYCERRGIKLSTLGKYAVDDTSLFHRLMNGGRCFPETMDKVRAYMAANPPQKQTDRAAS